MKEKRWDTVRKERMATAVAAAKKLFLEQKIENVKMTQIADLAGYGVASLYRYFETKESIAIAVATDLWLDLRQEVLPLLETDSYLNKKGFDQLAYIFDIYADLLRTHQSFLLFIQDFDAFCLKEQIPKEHLIEYDAAIQKFYLLYQNALEQGLQDGSLCLRSDPQLLYLTMNHAMLSLMEKIAGGDILKQDQHGAEEVKILKQIFLHYLTPDS